MKFLLLLLLLILLPFSSPSPLDPKQLTALQSLGLALGTDPCAPHNNATACDSGSPFRHLLSLHLSNCSSQLPLSPSALSSLLSLRSLSFSLCPIPPFNLLPRLHNLTDLSIQNPISPLPPLPSPFHFLSHIPTLRSATISNTSLSARLPRRWHSLSLSHLDLSLNALQGPVPPSISLLESLRFLNLSSNSLSGLLPDTIGDLIFLKTLSFASNALSGPLPHTIASLPHLAFLDLSFNHFNATVPGFFSDLKSLTHLNLESNDFRGVLPFRAAFIQRLELFKVGGNANLCYNRSLLSPKLNLGIAPCDKYGLPVPPPPGKADKDDSFSDYDYGADEEGGGGDEKGGGGRHGVNTLVLGVAIALSCLFLLLIFFLCLSKLWR